MNKTFDNVKQNLNSTFQLEINSGQNILFTSQSFNNIRQSLQSKLLISIINSFDVYFSEYSLKNFYQENQSLIDISVKYGQNLIFENYAIYYSNILRIAFQHSRGTLQMATNAFSRINQSILECLPSNFLNFLFLIDADVKLIFQITNSSDFYFRFNQSISFKLIEILDRFLSPNDFCRISNIPSHVPIKLLSDTSCSCTVYYLYRYHLDRSILKKITPTCYSNMSSNEIELEENECSFENKISHCQQMDGEIQINIPQGICLKDLTPTKLYNNNNNKISSFIIFLILFPCLIFFITCIYVLFSNYRTSFLSKYFRLQTHSPNSIELL